MPVTQPAPSKPTNTEAALALIDGGAPVDAYEISADEWRRRQTDHERGVAACARVHHPCNPPPPPPAMRILRGRAHALGREHGVVVYAIRIDDAGLDLSTGWRAFLVDDAGQDIGELTLTKRDGYRGTLQADPIPVATQVRFEAVAPPK